MSPSRIRIAGVAIGMTAIAAVLAIESRAHATIIAPNTTCTSTSPCITYSNTSSGNALKGTSALGTGLVGTTAQASTSALNGKAGVFGSDLSVGGTFDSGVRGTSTRGTGVSGSSSSGAGVSGTSGSNVGVIGKSSSGSGVSGTSSTSVGVLGISTSYVGTYGISTNSSGVVGSSTNSYGVVGGTNATSGSTIAAVQANNSASAAAFRANGFGGPLFVGNSSKGVDVIKIDDSGSILDAGEIVGGTSQNFSYGVVGYGTLYGVVGSALSNTGAGVYATGASGSLMYAATNSSNTQVMKIDDGGNLTLTGQIFTAGTCNLGCAVTPKGPGPRVVTYAPRDAEPTTEDVGEGQLVNGAAYVRLDPAFANVMDQGANYFVFITPEGDNRGLYVTGKSLAGFAVRESQGGRSTLAFSYRIVAKPFGPRSPRLARVNPVGFAHFPHHVAPATVPKTRT